MLPFRERVHGHPPPVARGRTVSIQLALSAERCAGTGSSGSTECDPWGAPQVQGDE